MQLRVQSKPLTVTVNDEQGCAIWSYSGGDSPCGTASESHISDGTQERIIDALLLALVQARGQLGGAFQVTNIVPYVRQSATQVDHDVPVT